MDDNQQMREVMKCLLGGLADETKECGDGAEALEFYIGISARTGC